MSLVKSYRIEKQKVVPRIDKIEKKIFISDWLGCVRVWLRPMKINNVIMGEIALRWVSVVEEKKKKTYKMTEVIV